ncbi:MAG: DEAD/DEAH box helicase [bacterium]
MSRTIFFDLETKFSADEVGGWSNIMDMGMAVGVIYDTIDGDFHVYLEHEMPALIAHLRNADLTVGFNHLDFDLRVVAGSEPTEELRNRLYLELRGLTHFDILAELKKVLGHRLKLDSLVRPTLEEGKSADGLQSLQWYKEGRMDLIIDYCKQDVDVTRRLFEYALEHRHLLYDSRSGIKTVALDWHLPGTQAAEVPSEQMTLFE